MAAIFFSLSVLIVMVTMYVSDPRRARGGRGLGRRGHVDLPHYDRVDNC